VLHLTESYVNSTQQTVAQHLNTAVVVAAAAAAAADDDDDDDDDGDG